MWTSLYSTRRKISPNPTIPSSIRNYESLLSAVLDRAAQAPNLKPADLSISTSCGGFLKMVGFPNNQCFPTKNDHFGVFWGYHHLRKHPCLLKHHISFKSFFLVSFFLELCWRWGCWCSLKPSFRRLFWEWSTTENHTVPVSLHMMLISLFHCPFLAQKVRSTCQSLETGTSKRQKMPVTLPPNRACDGLRRKQRVGHTSQQRVGHTSRRLAAVSVRICTFSWWNGETFWTDWNAVSPAFFGDDWFH